MTMAFDAHGNRVFSVRRDATAGYAIVESSPTQVDAWGAIRRAPTAPTSTNGLYTANLGHVMDDESGLTYMRVRYYEPSTGRFISEDPARDGFNWYIYANCNPTFFVDYCGKNSVSVVIGIANIAGTVLGGFTGYALTVMVLNAMFPGYQKDHLGSACQQGFVGILSGALGMVGTAVKDARHLRQMSLKELARTFSRSLAQTSLGPAAKAGGLGFAISFMFGVNAAQLKFYMSPPYADALDRAFF